MTSNADLFPPIEITLGAKKRKLKFSKTSRYYLETVESPGFLASALPQVREGTLTLGFLVPLLWACLLNDMPEFKVRKEAQVLKIYDEIIEWLGTQEILDEAAAGVLISIFNSQPKPVKDAENTEGNEGKNEQPV